MSGDTDTDLARRASVVRVEVLGIRKLGMLDGAGRQLWAIEVVIPRELLEAHDTTIGRWVDVDLGR